MNRADGLQCIVQYSRSERARRAERRPTAVFDHSPATARTRIGTSLAACACDRTVAQQRGRRGRLSRAPGIGTGASRTPAARSCSWTTSRLRTLSAPFFKRSHVACGSSCSGWGPPCWKARPLPLKISISGSELRSAVARSRQRRGGILDCELPIATSGVRRQGVGSDRCRPDDSRARPIPRRIGTSGRSDRRGGNAARPSARTNHRDEARNETPEGSRAAAHPGGDTARARRR